MKNLAVVGLGYWGPNLVRNALKLPNGNLYAVCDMDKNRLEKATKMATGIKTFTDFNQLLTDPEVHCVLLATPISTHYALAKQALNAGKHVFVEKPLTLNHEEALELTQLADSLKLKLCVGHTFLYTGAVERMKELIDNGDIGPVVHIHTERLNLGLFQKDTNVVWDLMPHDISMILHLLGNKLPTKVIANGSSHYNPKIEDTAYATLLFDNNISAHIHVSWVDPLKVRKFTVV